MQTIKGRSDSSPALLVSWQAQPYSINQYPNAGAEDKYHLLVLAEHSSSIHNEARPWSPVPAMGDSFTAINFFVAGGVALEKAHYAMLVN